MTNYDVIKKLIGDIRPKGDSSRDENLKINNSQNNKFNSLNFDK